MIDYVDLQSARVRYIRGFISLNLVALQQDLRGAVEAAFGLDGLGMCCVKNVPNFQQLRENLLRMALK